MLQQASDSLLVSMRFPSARVELFVLEAGEPTVCAYCLSPRRVLTRDWQTHAKSIEKRHPIFNPSHSSRISRKQLFHAWLVYDDVFVCFL